MYFAKHFVTQFEVLRIEAKWIYQLITDSLLFVSSRNPQRLKV